MSDFCENCHSRGERWCPVIPRESFGKQVLSVLSKACWSLPTAIGQPNYTVEPPTLSPRQLEKVEFCADVQKTIVSL